MIPIQITIRDMTGSATSSQMLEKVIRKKAEKLTQFYHLQNCHVVVKMPQKHKHQGRLFCVHIDSNVPGKKLVVDSKENEDVYVAVQDAFQALKRQIEQYTDRRRGQVKSHTQLALKKREKLLIEVEDATLH
jgi:ribosomal subunit interface protein